MTMNTAIEKLKTALESDDEADRIYAVEDMADTGDPEAARALMESLPGESSQAVRDALIAGLKRLPLATCFDAMFLLFNSHDAFLRNAMVELFGVSGSEAVVHLSARMDDADADVRKLILDALFLIGGNAATAEIRARLRAALDDPSDNVRITAVEYLGRLLGGEGPDGDSASLRDELADEMIALLARDTEPMMRTAVLESLARFGCDRDIDGRLGEIRTALGCEAGLDRADAVFLPELIRLIGKCGGRDEIADAFAGLDDRIAYAEDLVHALGEASKRFERLFGDPRIDNTLGDSLGDSLWGLTVAIAANPDAEPSARDAAVELLLNESDDGNNVGAERRAALADLGGTLLEESRMRYSGVRLLACFGGEAGQKAIARILEETRKEDRDEELRRLCELVGRL